MRERLFTLACALGALALFVVMFARTERGLTPRRELPRPTTAEQRGNGYYAAAAWLRGEGIHTLSLRKPFDAAVTPQELAPGGNLFIVTLPATVRFSNPELVAIDDWIRRGNTLLVLAALSDNPDWSFLLGGVGAGDLAVLTGLEFETVRAREERRHAPPGAAAPPPTSGGMSGPPRTGGTLPRPAGSDPAAPVRALAQPVHATLVPNGRHAYLEGVREAIALSDYPAQAWTVRIPYEGFVLALAHQRETEEGILWTRPLGNGRIIVSGFGTLFTNRALGLADNARLLANIVGANVRPEGAVIFDDRHQGLAPGYDPDAFYRDGRFLSTVAILLGLWLAWVLGSTRLRIPVPHASVPREAELVRTTGDFFSRVLRPPAAALRLIDHFIARVRARLPRAARPASAATSASAEAATEEVWRFLERHPHVTAAELAQLRAWRAAALASKRVPLVRLQSLLARLEREIA